MGQESRKKANKIKLTRANIEKILLASRRENYWDTDLPGFCLRVSDKKKMFSVAKRVGGRIVWVSLGQYSPAYTPEKAREDAIKAIAELTRGENPNDKKKETKASSVTLKEVLDSYLEARTLKETTRKSYQYVVSFYLKDWLDRPLVSITKDQVEKKHKGITEEHGPTPANYAFKILRALFTYAEAKYENSKGNPLIAVNPVKRLSQVRAWNRVGTRRNQFIRSEDLPAWWKEVQSLTNETIRDYLTFLLLTGLRRQEAAQLRWADVNPKTKTLTIPDPKNRNPHILPLSDALMAILERRKKNAESLFVFPGGGKGGYIVEPKRALDTVREKSGITFMIHDLRRTFTVIAEQIVPVYTLKRLMNHAGGADVTFNHYLGTDETALRKHMQAITDRILELANANSAKTANEEGV